MNKENLLISFLQAWGILLVVIGHSFYNSPDNAACVWIYTFHMPLFIFISGYLLRYSSDMKKVNLSEMPLYGKKGFIYKKTKRLIIPYVVISSLAFFPKILLNRFATRPVDVSLEGYIKMLLYPWDNVIIFFWFLPTVFFILLLTVYGAHFLKHVKYRLDLFILFALLLLHLYNPFAEIKFLNVGGVFSYFFYFIVGYYCCKKNIEQQLQKVNPFLWTCYTFVLSVLFLNIPDFLGKDVLMAINGIVMSLFLGCIYIKYNWRFLHHLFGASYAIYLFSWFPQVLSQQVFLNVIHAPSSVGTLLAIFTGIYIPLFIYKWIIKNKGNKIGYVVAVLTGQ